ncbi:hypothetical protein H4219_002162 [Mycoemilia scoparia]|uniref:PET117 cytochrome c oxidase chaperone n=1 Tax=Mycoemilia scoparia TaxID=417184 RepID=A0A9W8A1T4_9FUNG|nr:hypothetical protein H4219_002162 [Mycoemilia scoparia]
MSRMAKLTFAGSCLFTVSTIWFVHNIQVTERENMYQGVLRDEERKKKREKNLREFEETRALHATLIGDQPDLKPQGNSEDEGRKPQ